MSKKERLKRGMKENKGENKIKEVDRNYDKKSVWEKERRKFKERTWAERLEQTHTENKEREKIKGWTEGRMSYRKKMWLDLIWGGIAIIRANQQSRMQPTKIQFI